MNRSEIARRIAALYPLRALRYYVRWKVQYDPAYEMVLEQLKGCDQPLVDIGCGAGLLAFFLRENGVTVPIVGIDFDERKIDVARIAAERYRDIDFIAADAHSPLPPGHNVVVLDMLHYCASDAQKAILLNIARAVPPGGIAVIRAGMRDSSWRFRLTWAVDYFARVIRWMRAEELNYLTETQILEAFPGFEHEVIPAWGGTPFNNYMFVMRRK